MDKNTKILFVAVLFVLFLGAVLLPIIIETDPTTQIQSVVEWVKGIGVPGASVP